MRGSHWDRQYALPRYLAIYDAAGGRVADLLVWFGWRVCPLVSLERRESEPWFSPHGPAGPCLSRLRLIDHCRAADASKIQRSARGTFLFLLLKKSDSEFRSVPHRTSEDSSGECNPFCDSCGAFVTICKL